jgi:hypothetical protein
MIRINRFGGLLTLASEYSVPPGGAVRQTNFTIVVPGQLTSRGGMRSSSFRALGSPPTGVIEQMFPISGGLGQPDRALVIDSTGKLGFVDGPVL